MNLFVIEIGTKSAGDLFELLIPAENEDEAKDKAVSFIANTAKNHGIEAATPSAPPRIIEICAKFGGGVFGVPQL